MKEVIANITEIFSSLQGEGPHTGEPTTFVRFSGCSIGCRWCDTDSAINKSQYYQVETPPRSGKFVKYVNPVTVGKLNEQVSFFTDPTISITGGEPLEQADFLAAWLPTLGDSKKFLLETNGIYHDQLEKIVKFVNTISMDIKLPSSASVQHYWKEHSAFLSMALQSGKETYVKIVLTPDTTDRDINDAIKLITSINRFVPVILQPASESKGFHTKMNDEKVESIARLCKSWLPNVSVMRQAHKELGIL